MRQSTLPSRPPAAICDPAALVDPLAVSDALARAGLRAVGLPPLRLEKAWPLPRIPLMLLYGEADASPGSAWWSLHALPEGRLPGAYRRAVKSGQASVLDELGAIAQRFPDDLMLPALAELMSRPEQALPRVSETTGRPLRGDLRARVVGYKPARRCSVRLAAAGAGTRDLFGKLLPPAVASRQWRVHAALDGAFALGAGSGIEVASPEWIVPDLGLLLWRPSDGVSVRDLLAGDAAAAVDAAGRALGGLHASPVAWTDIHGLERELATLGMWVGAAAGAFPERAAVLHAAEARLRVGAATLDAGPLLPAHRDFYDKQVLLDSGRAVLLDFETACRAEPELDVANFLAHLLLRTLQCSEPLESGLVERFVAAYGSVAGRLDRRRLRWYRAGALLRLACVYAFRGGWTRLSNDLLAAAGEAF